MLLLAAAPLPAAGRTPPPLRQKAIAAALQPFVDSHSLAGAVTLVADKDKVLSLEAVGFADVAAKKPMKTDALFWIASQSKPITATALMMLVDEGKVKLDDPVEKYLPEFKDQWLAVEQDKDHMLLKKPKHPITVRDILSHTSGLPFKSAMEQPTLDLLPLRDAVRSYAMTPLQFEPGTQVPVLQRGHQHGRPDHRGRQRHALRGRSCDKRLFEPLGMKDTTFWPNEEQLDAAGEVVQAERGQDRPGRDDDRRSSSTRSTTASGSRCRPAACSPRPRDVGRFCQMILNGGAFEGKRYLSEAAVKEMTSKQTGDAVKEGYGLGWSTGGGSFGHGGAYATNMTIDPKRGLITVFMVQHAGFPGDGGKSQGAFRKAAEEQFGKAK